MKEYVAKTLEDALKQASEEFETEVDNLVYSVEVEKEGWLGIGKKAVINVYEVSDVVKYAEDYILGITDSLGIEASANTTLKDDIIRITIDSTNNPILIGKNGRTLQAINDLTKLAVSSKFKRRFRLLVDVNGYKDSKYRKIAFAAKRAAREVQKTKVAVTLDPMPADERRIVHNTLHGFKNIKTESKGEGTHRQVNILYVENSVNDTKEVETSEE